MACSSARSLRQVASHASGTRLCCRAVTPSPNSFQNRASSKHMCRNAPTHICPHRAMLALRAFPAGRSPSQKVVGNACRGRRIRPQPLTGWRARVRLRSSPTAFTPPHDTPPRSPASAGGISLAVSAFSEQPTANGRALRGAQDSSREWPIAERPSVEGAWRRPSTTPRNGVAIGYPFSVQSPLTQRGLEGRTCERSGASLSRRSLSSSGRRNVSVPVFVVRRGKARFPSGR